MLTKKSFRAAIVGCGRIGCTFDDDPKRGYISTHAAAYTQTSGVELVALVDADREKLERYGRKFNVQGLDSDVQSMLRAERPDILSICTWNTTHLEMTRAAAEAGIRAVFCEKPIADSLSAADEMIRTCRDRKVLLMIDHQRRFDPFHLQIAEFIRHGRLGEMQQVTCYYTAGAANTGSHLFDLLRFYLGDVAWVQGRLSGNVCSNPQDPNIDGWIGFQSGLVAAIQACDVQAFVILEVNLIGTKGRLCVTSSGFDLEFEEVRESQRFAGYRELFPAAKPVRSDKPHEFMLYAVEHLLDCLNSAASPLCSGEDGRASLEIICALRESAEAGGKRVDLPLATSTITIQSR